MTKTNKSACDAAAFLHSRDRFLILTHRRPDGDTIGCAAALTMGLRSLGKTAFVLPNPELTPRYKPFLEPLYAPDGWKPDTVVAVDIASLKLLPANAAVWGEQVDLTLDHHGTNEYYAEMSVVRTDCAANGELIYEVLGLMRAPVTPEIADALYIALSTDTGCFGFSNTSAQTHRITAELFEKGCHKDQLNKLLFETMSRPTANLKGAVYGSMRYYAGGAVASAVLTRELIEKAGAREDDMEAVSAWARRVEGVKIGLTLTERTEGIKVSVRTEAPVDAARIAAQFGGGGHPRAAGCMIPGGIEEAEKALLRAVASLEEELEWTKEETQLLRGAI